jgi:hypothetical protein
MRVTRRGPTLAGLMAVVADRHGTSDPVLTAHAEDVLCGSPPR